MDPSSTKVLVLLPYTDQAKKVISHNHNLPLVDADVYNVVQIKKDPFPSSSYPSDDEDDDSAPTRENTPEIESLRGILLTLSKPPKDKTLGWVFGRDKATCDLLLPGRSTSNKHFRIHFNQTTGIVLITDTSLNGTILRHKPLKNATDVLFDHSTLYIPKCDVGFTVVFPDRPGGAVEYTKNVQRYLGRGVKLLGPIPPPAFPEESVVGGYRSLGRLGSGTSANVHKVIDVSGNLFACKEFRPGANPRFMRRELDLIRRISHGNVIPTLDIIHTAANRSLVIMELAHHGSLKSFYHSSPIRPPTTTTLSALRQISSALQYLHDQDILHRDVKPDNILVSSVSPTPVFKLADFGISTPTTPETCCGTLPFAAPEVLEYFYTGSLGNGYGRPADMWGLGVTVLDCLKGLPKWIGDVRRYKQYLATVKRRLKKGMKEGEVGEEVLGRLYGDLLGRLVCDNPNDRLTAAACVAAAKAVTDKRRTRSSSSPLAVASSMEEGDTGRNLRSKRRKI